MPSKILFSGEVFSGRDTKRQRPEKPTYVSRPQDIKSEKCPKKIPSIGANSDCKRGNSGGLEFEGRGGISKRSKKWESPLKGQLRRRSRWGKPRRRYVYGFRTPTHLLGKLPKAEKKEHRNPSLELGKRGAGWIVALLSCDSKSTHGSEDLIGGHLTSNTIGRENVLLNHYYCRKEGRKRS